MSVAWLQGKTGYFQWRENLKKAHASTVVGLMQQAGYEQELQDKVSRFILKKDLKKDPENQVRGELARYVRVSIQGGFVCLWAEHLSNL